MTETFETQRPRLLALGYRMLGSRTEAEDLVQEAWLRWESVDHSSIDSPAAWLTTTMSRLCIDELRARKVRQENYVGPWLPAPWFEEPLSPAPEALTELELADDLSMAFLLLLERLAPEERAAFLLHDIFEMSYSEIVRRFGNNKSWPRSFSVPWRFGIHWRWPVCSNPMQYSSVTAVARRLPHSDRLLGRQRLRSSFSELPVTRNRVICSSNFAG